MGVLLLKPNYEISFVDDSVCEMLNYDHQELFGKSFLKLIPSQNYEQVEQGIRQLFVGKSHEFETIQPLKRKDGSLFFLDLKASLASPHLENPYCLLAVSKTVDLPTSNGFTLHSNLVLAEAMQDSAAALTSTLDIEEVLDRILLYVGRVVPYDTASFMLMEGDTARIVRSRGWQEREALDAVLDVRFSVQNTHSLRTMYELGRPFSIPDTRLYDGWRTDIPEIQWIRSYIGVPVRTADEFIGFLNLDNSMPGAFSDRQAQRLQAFADQAAIAIKNARLYEAVHQHAITLEQRVQERTAELQRAKERLEIITNSISDAIILTSFDGYVIHTNPAFSEMFGYDAEDVIDRDLASILSPDNPESIHNELEVLKKFNQPLRLEMTVTRCDKQQFMADLALVPIPHYDANLSQIVWSLRDISKRIQIEQGLRQSLAREKELNDLKARFVSMVSHEFRTPLTVIRTNSYLLRTAGDGWDESQKLEAIGSIDAQVELLTGFLDEILMISKSDIVELECNPVPIEVDSFVGQIVNEVGQNFPTHEFQLLIKGECISVSLDPHLMRKSIGNIISNAAKYSPQGSLVRVEVDCAEEEIVFMVTDEGIGIPADDLDRIFDLFHRGKNVGEIVGTGLGMAIVKRSVEAHSGTVSIRSRLHQGTSVTFRIPQ